MGNLFAQLLMLLTSILNLATTTATETRTGLGLLKQYIDLKVSAINASVGNITAQINGAIETAKTILRGEIQSAKNQAVSAAKAYTDQEIATLKGQSEAFATSLVGSETTARGNAIGTLATNTSVAIAGVNDDLTATKARISAIETSDAGSADDFLPYTIAAGTTATLQAVLTASAATLNVTVEGDRTYLLMFRGGGGVQNITNGADTYDVNAGEKMRVKIAANGTIAYAIHIEDPYAEQLAEVNYGVTQINAALTPLIGTLTIGVTGLSAQVSLLQAAVTALTQTPPVGGGGSGVSGPN
jgi:hypothetical protein